MLTREEGDLLLKAARAAIEGYFGKESPSLSEGKNPRLWERRGVFVSLHKKGALRGCIGRVEPTEPLLPLVSQMALEAAFNDPRFPPLAPEELPQVTLELSVLSPLERCNRLEDIRVGRDGLLVEKEGHAGLLLPQVAEALHWTREAFLDNVCLKAGLPRDAWRHPGMTLHTFRAEIFSEEKS